MHRLKDGYELGCTYSSGCMHEFVLSASKQAKSGVHALDIAKALIEKGIHPPTVYFPLIVKESVMVEPTETETKETLDEFVRILLELADLAEKDPEAFRDFPSNTPVGRLDEVKAARDMDLASL
jgi:glycine dehydrogenase subunit 2